jgi:putative component of membrane protein insertase Oxa1/YidC/SpoIIIJ protein YidD
MHDPPSCSKYAYDAMGLVSMTCHHGMIIMISEAVDAVPRLRKALLS